MEKIGVKFLVSNNNNGMKITNKEITDATIEAIYWWNRTEHYYHQYFKRIDEIHKNKELFNFFTHKLFEVFLKEYSIRRNISAGYKSVDSFLNELTKKGFVKKVKSGDLNVIDNISGVLKLSGKSTKKETKSLLSKMAFLINPTVYSLYDTQSKASLWNIVKNDAMIKLKDLNSYSKYCEGIKTIQKQFRESRLFITSKEILKEYKATEAYIFFTNEENAFELRIIDKLLWIKGQKKDSRKINNEQYIHLLNIS